MNWQDQTVWVTGASSGIGEALSHELSRRGAALILSGRRVAELERVAAQIDGPSLVLPFEAADYDVLPAVVAEARAWRGGVDVLVNNAGIGQRSLAIDTDFEVYRRLMEIDFFAPLRLTQLVLPEMVARGSGRIIITSSIAGRLGTPLRSAYTAAKHAASGYFEALRTEVETLGVGVSVVMPGYIKTAISESALTGDGSPLGHTHDSIAAGMDAAAAAAAIVDGLAAGRREVVVAGAEETMGLALRRDNPDAVFDLLAAQGAALMQAREQAPGRAIAGAQPV